MHTISIQNYPVWQEIERSNNNFKTGLLNAPDALQKEVAQIVDVCRFLCNVKLLTIFAYIINNTLKLYKKLMCTRRWK